MKKNVFLQIAVSIPFFVAGMKILWEECLLLRVNGKEFPDFFFLLVFWMVPHFLIGIGIIQNRISAWIGGIAYTLILVPIFISLFTRQTASSYGQIAFVIFVYVINLVTCSLGYYYASKK